jgi:hypothetical protein
MSSESQDLPKLPTIDNFTDEHGNKDWKTYHKIYSKIWRFLNKEKHKEASKRWALENPDKVKEIRQRTYANRTEIQRERDRLCGRRHYRRNIDKYRVYYKKSRVRIRDYTKHYYKHNKDKITKWKLDNIEKLREQNRKRKRSPEWKAWAKIYYKERRQQDVEFRIMHNLRSRILYSLKHNTKHSSTIKSIGCTPTILKAYLEKQFDSNMNWDNYGNKQDNWNVDHILPLAILNLADSTEYRIGNFYLNLRPCWRPENVAKGAKILPEAIEYLDKLIEDINLQEYLKVTCEQLQALKSRIVGEK